jgi:hypothetical protein
MGITKRNYQNFPALSLSPKKVSRRRPHYFFIEANCGRKAAVTAVSNLQKFEGEKKESLSSNTDLTSSPTPTD